METSHASPARVAQLLRDAAKHLETVDPNTVIGDVAASAPGVTPQFAENAPGSLSLFMSPGGSAASALDRVEGSILAARRVVKRHLPEAARWLEQRIEPATARDYRPATSGGVFGSSFDRYGLAE